MFNKEALPSTYGEKEPVILFVVIVTKICNGILLCDVNARTFFYEMNIRIFQIKEGKVVYRVIEYYWLVIEAFWESSWKRNIFRYNSILLLCSTKVAKTSLQRLDFIIWCFDHDIKKLPNHWWTRCYHFGDIIGYHSYSLTSLQHPSFKNGTVIFFLYYQTLISTISRNFWQSFEKFCT